MSYFPIVLLESMRNLEFYSYSKLKLRNRISSFAFSSSPGTMHRVPPPVADTLSFPSDRSLLLPKFESYKLSLPTASSPSTSYSLPTPFETKPLGDGVRLGFSEVQSRAKHNHLAVGKAGELVWIEKDGKVKGVKLDTKVSVISALSVDYKLTVVCVDRETDLLRYPSTSSLHPLFSFFLRNFTSLRVPNRSRFIPHSMDHFRRGLLASPRRNRFI